MGTIADHFSLMLEQAHLLNAEGHITSPDELIAIHDLEIKINEMQRIFERRLNDNTDTTQPDS
jgi:hypothetical protein